MPIIFGPCSIYGTVEDIIREHLDWTDDQVFEEVKDVETRPANGGLYRKKTRDEWQEVIAKVRERLQ